MAVLHIFAMGMSGRPHSWKLRAAPVHSATELFVAGCKLFSEYRVTEREVSRTHCQRITIPTSVHIKAWNLSLFSIIIIHKIWVGYLTTSDMIFYDKSSINTGMT